MNSPTFGAAKLEGFTVRWRIKNWLSLSTAAKSALSSEHPLNAWFLGPHLHTPNGISIGSAVLEQLMLTANRQQQHATSHALHSNDAPNNINT